MSRLQRISRRTWIISGFLVLLVVAIGVFLANPTITIIYPGVPELSAVSAVVSTDNTVTLWVYTEEATYGVYLKEQWIENQILYVQVGYEYMTCWDRDLPPGEYSVSFSADSDLSQINHINVNQLSARLFHAERS